MTAFNQSFEPATRAGRWRRKRVMLPTLVALALAVGLMIAWISRERIANNVIASQLATYGIPATYTIERIDGRRQVLRDIVIGSSRRPDLTIERAEVRIAYGFGIPRVGRITLVKPRLFGRLNGGRLSFGSLDKVLYGGTGKPGLPNVDLAVEDGRALVRTPFGPAGVKLDGRGQLSDGFAGTLAIAAPQISAAQCGVRGASAYGRITSLSGQPRFVGPVRLTSIECPSSSLSLGSTDAMIDLTGDTSLASFSGRLDLTAGAPSISDIRADKAELSTRGRWKNGLLDLSYTAAITAVEAPQAHVDRVSLRGSSRATRGFSALDLVTDIQAAGIIPNASMKIPLAKIERAGEGTMVARLIKKIGSAIEDQTRGSALSANLTVRRRGANTAVVIPRAELRSKGGERLIALSRIAMSVGADSTIPRITGNIATGGPGMPLFTGRMERSATGRLVFRGSLRPYRAANAVIELPILTVVQGQGGAVGFAGKVRIGGPLPGGSAGDLAFPIDGRWSSDGALRLWRKCIDVVFDGLSLAQLRLTRRSLRVCPPPGRAIVERGRNGAVNIAAGVPNLALAGSLGSTQIKLASGPIGFAYPGLLTARRIAVDLGPVATASRFTIANLTARISARDFAGRFDDADVRLSAVPLDLRNASGAWRYANGVFVLDDGNFELIDRQPAGRFEPLRARNGQLRLADNTITALAALRNPDSDRVVADVSLMHDLAQGSGHADLTVSGLLFDERLQPVALTKRALGVIANARGTVSGVGRIDWNPREISSTGEFSSESLDFAAAFGPVRGARGTIQFTDLIGLTTEPGQTLSVASINPGIEVTDGEVRFQLRGGQTIKLEGGSWPFMGGKLILRGVDLNFGIAEERRYIFDIEGLDAATFIARFELPNIAATGRFDGTVPIIFDSGGNGRIEQGLLVSRPPGGNVSYVGDLTYKDLSPIANFAFDALRSLDYREMRIAMNGALTGELVTNVQIDQVRQGQGARRNFITRALANLPLQFRINITAPFYQLITSFRGLRDPNAIRDPRELGLLSDDGVRLKPAVRAEDAPASSETDGGVRDATPVKSKESENMP